MATSSARNAEQHADTEDDRNRLRVSKACTRCRVRKDKCDGLSVCTNCKNVDQPCIYEATTKKRGLPEGYVRGLEKLLTLSSQSIDGFENVVISYLRDGEVQKNWNTSAGDELYTQWKDSNIRQELEGFLQSNTTTTGKRKRAVDEESADSPTDQLETLLEYLRQSHHHVAHGQQSSTQTYPSDTQRLALPTNGQQLLGLYFSYVHCWLPVLNRPSVQKAFYGCLRGKQDKNALALLWAIFAYAIRLVPDSSAKLEISHQYAAEAFQYLPIDFASTHCVGDPQIVHGQALLILSLLKLGDDEQIGAWICIAVAARIALLCRQSTNQSVEIDGLLQGCSIVEASLNLRLEAESVLTRMLERGPLDEDGHDEWEPWKSPLVDRVGSEPSFSLSTFNRLTKVLTTLNEATSQPRQGQAGLKNLLGQMNVLVQETAASGISEPSMESPPHHIFFRMVAVMAQLRILTNAGISSSIEGEALVTDADTLLQMVAKQSPGVSCLPPILANLFTLCIKAVGTTTKDLSQYQRDLATIWPVFGKDGTPLMDSGEYVVQDTLLRSETFVPSASYNGYRMLGLRSQTPTMAQSLSAFTSHPVPQTRYEQTPQPVLDQFSPTYHRLSHSNSLSQAVFQPNVGSNAGFPASSPSFQGDEVDAIFHEMAHLDTNEWTNERALGLKEFGFTDESAFMEFCNDPERLALPLEGSGAPLSSTRQSWTFDARPP